MYPFNSMMVFQAGKLLSDTNAENEITKVGAKLGKRELESDTNPTSQDKAKASNSEAMSNNQDIDFNSFLIPTESATQASSQAEGDTGLPKTGIKELDEKIASGNLSMFDYYKAKNFLGIDMNLYINGNLNLNQKIANTTKATQGIYDTIKSLELGDNIIEKAQNNSGVLNGLRRKANELTGGFYSLEHDLAQTDNLATTYAYSVARALGNGKTNLEQQRDAKAMNAFKAKSAEENTSRMGQNQDIQLTYLKNQIAELESLGGRVPNEVYERLREYERKIDYINANNGKIDIKKYKSLGLKGKQELEAQEKEQEKIKRLRG